MCPEIQTIKAIMNAETMEIIDSDTNTTYIITDLPSAEIDNDVSYKTLKSGAIIPQREFAPHRLRGLANIFLTLFVEVGIQRHESALRKRPQIAEKLSALVGQHGSNYSPGKESTQTHDFWDLQ